MKRWSKSGVLDRVFQQLQYEQIIRIKIEAVSVDSTIIRVYPDRTVAAKNGPQAVEKSLGGWTTKLHMAAAYDRTAIVFALSPAQDGDALMGRELLRAMGRIDNPIAVLMDQAYEGDVARERAGHLGFVSVVPTKANRRRPWSYDRDICKRRNEVERLFRRLKGFRRTAIRYDKLDVIFLGFIHLALIFDGLKR